MKKAMKKRSSGTKKWKNSVKNKGQWSAVRGDAVFAKKGKAFTYARVSSKKQTDGSGLSRQKEAAQRQAKLVLGKVKGKLQTINEVVSGTKPLDQRALLGELMKQNKIKIFVENARAIARSAKVGEDIYEMAKMKGIQIIADDIPNLFALKPRPVETFVRLVTMAVYQLERDLIVERLTHGLSLAKKKTKRITQDGEPKVNGSRSHLEKKPPNKKQLKELRQVVKKQRRGDLSWRQTQSNFRRILKKPRLGLHTVRRQMRELEVKHNI